MKKYLFYLIALFTMGFSSAYAAPITIGVSIPDLGSIASYIGGEKVSVFSIAKPSNNTHTVEVLSSYMIRVSKAVIYLKVGMALDQWAGEIIDGSRNSKLLIVDCSQGISALQKPTGRADSSMGDIHPEGNPHYWLNPSNGIIIANTLLSALKKTDPANSALYEKNFENFKAESEKRISDWKSKMEKLAGQKIITYHSSWIYFTTAFALNIAGYVEPLPGIPPTGKHLAGLINTIKGNGISILLAEPYFPDSGPKFLARQTGIRVFKIAPSCDDVRPDSYFKHFDDLIDKISN